MRSFSGRCLSPFLRTYPMTYAEERVDPMRLEQIRLREIAIPLKEPFITAHGVEKTRRVLIVEAVADGVTGWGEVSALSAPYYTEETHETARLILESFLIPIALHTQWRKPQDMAAAFRPVRRHFAAKAGLEAAIWDLYARMQGLPLYQVLGGTQKLIPAGVAVGIERDVDRLLATVERRLQEGYRRIKLKITPGWDEAPLLAVRARFGDIMLMADANSAYTLHDTETLKRLDDLGLLMIEQPLAADDIIDHAKLQPQLRTDLCLDESILSVVHARQAAELGSCRVINIKPARVGGLTEALAIHEYCYEQGIPVWCGGMLESGIGRAHNLALASLPGFTLPGDISASDRYWEQDVIVPPVTMSPDGFIRVPDGIGLGYEIDTDALETYTVWMYTYTAS